MKWLSFIALLAIVATGCERHPVSTLDTLPGHHEAHGGEHADEAAHTPSGEHAPAQIPHKE